MSTVRVEIQPATSVRVVSVSAAAPVAVAPVPLSPLRVDFIARGPSGRQGDQGVVGPDGGVDYVNSIPDLTLIFNNGIV